MGTPFCKYNVVQVHLKDELILIEKSRTKYGYKPPSTTNVFCTKFFILHSNSSQAVHSREYVIVTLKSSNSKITIPPHQSSSSNGPNVTFLVSSKALFKYTTALIHQSEYQNQNTWLRLAKSFTQMNWLLIKFAKLPNQNTINHHAQFSFLILLC